MHANKDFDIVENDIQKAFALAEHYTKQGYEVTKPRSYDGGKTYTFTVSTES